MRVLISLSLCLFLFACQPKSHPTLLQSEEITLSTPIITIDSVLFNHQATITVLPPHPESIIRYTTDGKIPTEASAHCPNTLVLDENTDVKFKVFHPDFKSSEPLFYSLRKTNSSKKPQILTSSTPAKSPYEGKGLDALINLGKGTINFKANQEWLGHQNELVELHLLFEQMIYCEQLILSTLSDPNSWIFNPHKIEIVQNEKVIATKNIEPSKENQAARFEFLEVPIKTVLKEVTLKIYMEKIPDWHAGKGTIPWFFIDEIIVQ